MKIIIKSGISSRFLTFRHEFFMESLRVFSYDLENSCCWQKTIHNTPIRCVPNVSQMFCEFWKMLGFIAWRFHMKTCWKESEILRKNWVNPGPFTCALDVGAVRMMLVCPTIIPRLRRRPNTKKLQILVKRWSNVQSDHQKQRFYMVFTGNKFKYKLL